MYFAAKLHAFQKFQEMDWFGYEWLPGEPPVVNLAEYRFYGGPAAGSGFELPESK
jgi:hypothetical protein